MVARITTPRSLQKTLNYNEKKVQNGTAVCIGENGFLLPLNKMNFYDKLEGFEYRNRLNDSTTRTLHVSLNFSNADRLDDTCLMQIATDYMARIGFAEQPYLVYHHHDAGHPHIHILSTLIRADGTRINTHNIGRDRSEPARKLLEEKYGLVQAEKQASHGNKIVPFNLEKITYGRIETKRGIANVLLGVLGTYNYTSLPELNAVLRQFNVFADRCEEGGYIYSKRGLYYRVLVDDGVSVGVPIKASSMAGNPTLNNLEKRFEINKKSRDPLKAFLKDKIDQALLKHPESLAALTTLLLQQNVLVIARQNAEGKLYGITFVDNQNRSVFNGSEIGRQYSVAGLLKQMTGKYASTPGMYQIEGRRHKLAGAGFIEFNGLSPLTDLIKPENEFNPVPYQLIRKKRKRKR